MTAARSAAGNLSSNCGLPVFCVIGCSFLKTGADPGNGGRCYSIAVCRLNITSPPAAGSITTVPPAGCRWSPRVPRSSEHVQPADVHSRRLIALTAMAVLWPSFVRVEVAWKLFVSVIFIVSFPCCVKKTRSRSRWKAEDVTRSLQDRHRTSQQERRECRCLHRIT